MVVLAASYNSMVLYDIMMMRISHRRLLSMQLQCSKTLYVVVSGHSPLFPSFSPLKSIIWLGCDDGVLSHFPTCSRGRLLAL